VDRWSRLAVPNPKVWIDLVELRDPEIWREGRDLRQRATARWPEPRKFCGSLHYVARSAGAAPLYRGPRDNPMGKVAPHLPELTASWVRDGHPVFSPGRPVALFVTKFEPQYGQCWEFSSVATGAELDRLRQRVRDRTAGVEEMRRSFAVFLPHIRALVTSRSSERLHAAVVVKEVLVTNCSDNIPVPFDEVFPADQPRAAVWSILERLLAEPHVVTAPDLIEQRNASEGVVWKRQEGSSLAFAIADLWSSKRPRHDRELPPTDPICAH
jgi:hypothetical protein